MQRAWVVLLAGCGFQAAAPSDDAGSGSSMDGSGSGSSQGVTTCWKVKDANHLVDWSACTTTALPETLNVFTASIDTDTGVSTPAGLSCLEVPIGVVTNGNLSNKMVCALAASTVTLPAGVVLSAHGGRPLALFGHTIDIEGAIDVASHFGGQRGPASTDDCNPATGAKGGGGGFGGTLEGTAAGGQGGNQGGVPNTAGKVEPSTSISFFRGGCDGGAGGDGTMTTATTELGGAGGGAVWISTDTDAGMLTIGHDAVINASGAGGAGGKSTNHGGSGGGSGGMIMLRAMMINYDPAAMIFANGGDGGGGAQDVVQGVDGKDPIGPAGNGQALAFKDLPLGSGGSGFPNVQAGADGIATSGGGGGGGGGGGTIRIASRTMLKGTNFSPQPAKLDP